MSPKAKLLPIADVVKRLKDDWSLTVKARDGFKCVLCPNTTPLTAHHWVVCDHNSRMARFSYDNGVTLCYGCHIHQVHTYPDWATAERIRVAVGLSLRALPPIVKLSETEVAAGPLRALYAERFTDCEPVYLRLREKPVFDIIRGRLSLRIAATTRRKLAITVGKRVAVHGAAGGPVTVTVRNITGAGNDDRLTLEPTEELKQWILDNVE